MGFGYVKIFPTRANVCPRHYLRIADHAIHQICQWTGKQNLHRVVVGEILQGMPPNFEDIVHRYIDIKKGA